MHKNSVFLAFWTSRSVCFNSPRAFLIFSTHKCKAVEGTQHPIGLWLLGMGKMQVADDTVCRVGELPVSLRPSGGQGKGGGGLIPTMRAGPASTFTLCVTRPRSSPLSSLLSGIDYVVMFWDTGFLHPSLSLKVGVTSSLEVLGCAGAPRRFSNTGHGMGGEERERVAGPHCWHLAPPGAFWTCAHSARCRSRSRCL